MAISKKEVNKGGRPLKFKSKEELEARIEEFYYYCETHDKPLTISRLAVFLDVDRSTLTNYSNKQEFFDTIKKVKERVEADMEERALSNKSNATFSIFSLKNNYNWKDKTEVEQNITNFDKFFTEE